MLPQLGNGGGTPKPRKLNVASAIIAFPISRVKITIMIAVILGKICRSIMCGVDIPRTLAASTYKFFLIAITALRINLTRPPIPACMPNTIMTGSRPGPDNRDHG